MAATQIAETRYIARGLGAGLAGGLAAFVFTKLFAEPVVQSAIDYESGRARAQGLLDRAAGLPAAPAGHELFTRGVQGGIGAGVGLVLFGLALGGIFSVVFVLASRRWPTISPRPMAAFVAVALLVGLYLIPSLKYPANPPAIGHEATIRARSELYLVMVIASVVALLAAIALAGRLAGRMGAWNGALLAALSFAVIIGVVMAILPPVGHLADNLALYGRHATETPLPLKNAAGAIVFPGFPADLLAKFRLYSVLSQAVMWGTLGLVYGPLVQRMTNAAVAADRRAVESADAVAA